jgi:hypothetical protein
MGATANDKGKAFEAKVEQVLRALLADHPNRVRLYVQPSLPLYDGEAVRADFDLRYDLPMGESRQLIECQIRKRSSKQLLHKIRYLKSLSARNRVIYVHGRGITKKTRRAYENDGVLVMSLKEFCAYVVKLSDLLTWRETVEDDARKKAPTASVEDDAVTNVVKAITGLTKKTLQVLLRPFIYQISSM